MSKSTSRDEIHRMVDTLPLKEIAVAKRFLEFLLSQAKDDPWAEFLENPPENDEPLTTAELEAIEEAMEDVAAGRVRPWEEARKELGLK